jgi:hypothetical protein
VSPDNPQFEKYWRDRIAKENGMISKTIDVHDWVQYGVDMGWSSDIFCETHDGGPVTEEEYKQWDDGQDPCAPMIRLW